MNILHRLCLTAAKCIAGSALGHLLAKPLSHYAPQALKVFLLLSVLPQSVQLCGVLITLPAFALGIFSTVYISESRYTVQACPLFCAVYNFILGAAVLSGMSDSLIWQFVPTGALQGQKMWLLSALTFIPGGLMAVWLPLPPRLVGMMLALTSGMMFQSATDKSIGFGTLLGLILTVL